MTSHHPFSFCSWNRDIMSFLSLHFAPFCFRGPQGSGFFFSFKLESNFSIWTHSLSLSLSSICVPLQLLDRITQVELLQLFQHSDQVPGTLRRLKTSPKYVDGTNSPANAKVAKKLDICLILEGPNREKERWNEMKMDIKLRTANARRTLVETNGRKLPFWWQTAAGLAQSRRQKGGKKRGKRGKKQWG